MFIHEMMHQKRQSFLEITKRNIFLGTFSSSENQLPGFDLSKKIVFALFYMNVVENDSYNIHMVGCLEIYLSIW